MIFWKCFFDLFDPSSKNCFKQGKVTFAELEWGEYSVEEVKAPEGYRMNLQIFEFVINGENLTEEISVKNEPIDWEIPKTGGIGTLGFYGLGILLVVVGFWLLQIGRASCREGVWRVAEVVGVGA